MCAVRIAGAPAERHRRRVARKRLIVEVAARAFADRGFSPVSMDEIALKAEVSKPVLYDHFASKEALYEASVVHAANELAARLGRAVSAEGTADRQMWRGIGAFLEAVEEHPEWWLLTRQASQMKDLQLAGAARESHRISTEAIRTLFDLAASSGTPVNPDTLELLANGFVGACASVAVWWIAHPEVAKASVAATLMNMLWMGFGDLLERNFWLPPEAS